MPKKQRRRSKFEARVEKALGKGWQYEALRLAYTLENNYVPDFLKGPLIVEAKGRFTGHDRRKMLAVKGAHPSADIRFCFMRNQPLYKGAKSTYMEWAAKHGFPATVFPELPVSKKELH